jgi:hypothetical protein
MAHTPSKLSDRVAAALQEMQAGSPAAEAGKITGWRKPSDYSSVRDCLRATKHTVFAQ